VSLHKRLRPLLHSGNVVRLDHVDPSLIVHAVVAADQSDAVVSIASIRTSDSAPTGRLVLSGLNPTAIYDISLLPPGDVIRGNNHRKPAWITAGTRLNGAALQHAGLQLPDLFPEQLILLRLLQVS
jgi:alpha-galactosidase